MHVRAATAADAEAIGLVRVAAWRAAYRGVMPAEFLDALDPGQNLEGLRAALSAAEPPFGLRVAAVEGAVVAFVTYGAPRYDARPGTLELWALNIAPDHWRRGIGRALVGEVLAAARDAALQRAELWCIEGNVPARSLYESTGFVLTGKGRTNSGLTGHPLHEVAYETAP
jgi:GNAT superfamily N-acetyltransferase